MGKFSTPVRTGPLAARVHVKRPNASAPKMRHQSWLGSRRTQQIVGRACGVRRRAVIDNVALSEWAEKRLQGIGTAQALGRKSKNDRPRAAPLQDIGVKAHRRQRLRDSRHALQRMDKMWRTNGVRRRVVAMQASSSRRPHSGVAATLSRDAHVVAGGGGPHGHVRGHHGAVAGAHEAHRGGPARGAGCGAGGIAGGGTGGGVTGGGVPSSPT